MSVVVTGAAGFIGRHVVGVLRSRGVAVVGIDRRPWVPTDGERLLLADLALPSDEVDTALREAEGVIHLAGRPGVRDRDPSAEHWRHRDNVVAGQRVLDVTPASTPVVVASSSSVYGGSRAGRPSHELDPVRPRGGYARSKAALEERCHVRAARGGLVSVARPFTVAGEGQRPDMAFSIWIDAALRGEPLTVLGDLRRRRDVTDVRDVAEGFVRLLERAPVTTVNLGTGTDHDLRTMAETVARVCDVPLRTATRPASADEVTRTLADPTRCRRLLDLSPTTDLDGLVRRQVAATNPTLVLETT